MLAKMSLNLEKVFFGFCSDHIEIDVDPKQFGVQSNKRAFIQLIDFVESVHPNRSPQLHAICLDYEKVFNKVPFELLLSKRNRLMEIKIIFLNLIG